MKIALVHDHLAQDGGAEKVLKVFQEIYPKAPTFVLVHDLKKANKAFLNKDIRPSFIQRMPGGVSKYRWFLPLMPTAVENFNLMDYDLVLSSTSSFAKGIITKPETLHLCYCHTPTRFLWSDTHSYVEELSYGPLVRRLIPLVLNHIRMWDKLAAERVDKFIANSETVRKRIKKYYNRDSVIIYPPVDIEKFKISSNLGNYYLMGGRLVYYKRFDLGIKAFNRLGLPLKIFGEGPEFGYLKRIARPNIEFLGRISEEEKAKLFSEAITFISPQEEDFGIMLIESMASGRPVIAYAKGGAAETVIPQKTGVFIEEQTWEALADMIIHFKPEEFNPPLIQTYAKQFDINLFKDKIKTYVAQSWDEFKKNSNN